MKKSELKALIKECIKEINDGEISDADVIKNSAYEILNDVEQKLNDIPGWNVEYSEIKFGKWSVVLEYTVDDHGEDIINFYIELTLPNSESNVYDLHGISAYFNTDYKDYDLNFKSDPSYPLPTNETDRDVFIKKLVDAIQHATYTT